MKIGQKCYFAVDALDYQYNPMERWQILKGRIVSIDNATTCLWSQDISEDVAEGVNCIYFVPNKYVCSSREDVEKALNS